MVLLTHAYKMSLQIPTELRKQLTQDWPFIFMQNHILSIKKHCQNDLQMFVPGLNKKVYVLHSSNDMFAV